MKNKRGILILRIILFVGTAISLYYVPWPILTAWIKPLPDTVQEQVEEAIPMGFDGIIVYVDQKGKAPAFYAAGTKNKAQNIPADPHALFKIASVSKLYNALAIAKLVRSGKLSLDQTLAFYLPELKERIEYADKITLRLMVQHRSGIPNFTNTKDYWLDPKSTYEENIALILDQPANFAPGKSYEYCNTNYLLLAHIMDEVLGYSSAKYIKKEILDPLNLNNTFSSIKDVNIDDVMSGYYVGYEPDLKTNDMGSMLATADDLGTFIRALNDGSIFKDREEQDIYSSIYVYEHTGLIPGYQTIAKYHKAIDAVVIQFTNTVDFNGYNWNLSEVEYNRVIKILEKEQQ
ncbi:serine hydrolase [Flammeovirga sp. SJP92]|uniref:serine hydrolase domain-containing protein n=1 Tax=Flammeovirga sp. SJP92 TaxID=1775430 RepID=UPI0007874428|nr:serine hydrolase domain-containing protein [Flammeovirga sp. SJP92]KXX70889.1 serine hydrolase [Flammeovirga sp. SJP92]